MTEEAKTHDRRFGWVAALALICGAAVLVPSLWSLTASLLAVLHSFW